MLKPVESKSTISVPEEVINAFGEAYADEEIIEAPDYTLMRIDGKGKRYYAKVYDDGRYMVAGSVTSIISSQGRMSPFLRDWFIKFNSYADSQKEAECAANYGTWCHIVWGELLLGGMVELSKESLLLKLDEFCFSKGHDVSAVRDWYIRSGRDVRKDMVGFIKWMQDFKVKPIMLEMPFFISRYFCENCGSSSAKLIEKCHCGSAKIIEKGSNAGTLDLVAAIEVKGVQLTAIIDYKSGLKGFFEDHIIQLAAYRDAVNTLYPSLNAHTIFNWAPADFRIPPGKTSAWYKFQNQTGEEITQKRWWYYLNMFLDDPKNTEFKVFQDFKPVELDMKTDITSIFHDVDPFEAIKEVNEKQDR